MQKVEYYIRNIVMVPGAYLVREAFESQEDAEEGFKNKIDYSKD